MAFDLDAFLPCRLSAAAARASRRFARRPGWRRASSASRWCCCRSARKALTGRLGAIAAAFQAELLAELGPDASGLDAALRRIEAPEAEARDSAA